MSQLKSIFNQYSAQGLALVLVVGQDAYQYPSTSSVAKQYKQSKGFPAGVIAVSDPNWNSTDSVIQDKTGTLPSYNVIDGTGKLRFASDSWSGLNAAKKVLVDVLNEP